AMADDPLMAALLPTTGSGLLSAFQQQPMTQLAPQSVSPEHQQAAEAMSKFAGPTSGYGALLAALGQPRPDSTEQEQAGQVTPEMQEAIASRFPRQEPRWELGNAAQGSMWDFDAVR